MSFQPVFRDLVNFVLKNKADKSFIGLPDDTIIMMLNLGVQHNLLFYACDDKEITGMILAEKHPSDVLFVTANLSMNISNLRKFAAKAKLMYPTLKLEWLKRGIHKKHSTDRIYKKLL